MRPTARDAIILENMRFAEYVAAHFEGPLDEEELRTGALVGLCRAVAQFDRRRCTNPKVYVRLCVMRELHNMVRTKREPPRELPPREPDHDTLEFVDLYDAISRLPPLERSIVRGRYFDDMSLRDIACALGCTYHVVDYRHGKAMLELKDVLG